MGAPKASFVKRARLSAGAGPYLLTAGIVAIAVGLYFGPLYWPIILAMTVVAPILQFPRQKAWLTQNDMLEFASLAAMPIVLGLLAWLWLSPAGKLSLSTILQGLSGFFLSIGLFHILTKQHTLNLADEIENQD